MTVRFSIFIPVWNDGAWLSGAIESVLAQSHQDWELVIGDNASTDELASVAAQFYDPRIRYHRWQTHTDIYENFNRTLLLCNHEWLQMLAADDRLDPQCLETMAERIERFAEDGQRLAMVLTKSVRLDRGGSPADSEFFGYGRRMTIPDGVFDGSQWLSITANPGQQPWNFGSVALSRAVLAEAGSFFRPEVGLCAAEELAFRISAFGRVAYIDEPLLHFTVRSASDGSPRALRNLSEGDPYTPHGAAWLSALRAHSARRTVTSSERSHIHKAVARTHLQRALQHRTLPGGHGRKGAFIDTWRAFRYSPATLFSWRLVIGLLATLAPSSLIRWSLTRLAGRRQTINLLPTALTRV